MPTEYIIVSVLLVVVCLFFSVFWIRRKQKPSPLIMEEPAITMSTAIDQSSTSESAMALSDIDGFILKNNSGCELTLSRPDSNQSLEKRYREIGARSLSAVGQVAQGAMPILAHTQTLANIARNAPNGLFTATASVQDLMRLSDGTVASAFIENGKIVAQKGFTEVTIKTVNPALVIGGIMQAMALVSGQYYMNEISKQLKSIDKKLDKLIGYHHDEKVGMLKNVNQELLTLISKNNVDASDIDVCKRLVEKCGEIFFEYQTRLERSSIDTKKRWLNKPKELRELGTSVDESEIDFSIQMCHQASVLQEKSKLAEVVTRMKIGEGQEQFVLEQIEDLRKGRSEAYHRNTQRYIEEHYAPVLVKAEEIVKEGKIPLLSADASEEAKSIWHRRESLINIVGTEGEEDLAEGMFCSLCSPRETLIMIDESSGT